MVVGCSLQEEDEGQALSFSQRSLLKVTVTQGRFSQSQCLGTLCLKMGEGGESRGKRGGSFLRFLLLLGLSNSITTFQGMDKSRNSCSKMLGLAAWNPKEPDSKPRDLCEPNRSEKHVSTPTLK